MKEQTEKVKKAETVQDISLEELRKELGQASDTIYDVLRQMPECYERDASLRQLDTALLWIQHMFNLVDRSLQNANVPDAGEKKE